MANGLMLADCKTRREVFDYNRKRGLTNYIDPFAQLFCIKYNYAPLQAYYWVEQSSLSNTAVDELRSNPLRSGFVHQILRASSLSATEDTGSTDTSKTYYDLGQEMKARVEVVLGADPVTVNQGGFALPHANAYGACSNFAAATFMDAKATECTQTVDLLTECETVLNPAYY